MKISLSTDSVTKAKADLVAVGVRARKSGADRDLAALDRAMGGALSAQAKDEDFRGQAGEILKVPTRGRVAASWVVLVGLGDRGPSARDAYTVANRGAAAAKLQKSVAVVLPAEATVESVRGAAEGALAGAYRYDRYLTGARKPKGGVQRALILCPGKPSDELEAAVDEGSVVAESVNLARDLVNAPPNDLTPIALAEAAVAAVKGTGVKTTVWNKRQIQRAGMRLFLAVNQGGGNEPRFVHLAWTPPRPKKKVAFVGKGLTFDSGGLCIKPAKGMLDMKCDMAGAATTIGVVRAAARLRLPVEVHGVIGCTENMSGDYAYRPGDVFTSLDGKTVEIINTDAEGRLVLADILAWTRDNLAPHLHDRPRHAHRRVHGRPRQVEGRLLRERRRALFALHVGCRPRRRAILALATRRRSRRDAEERHRRHQAHRRLTRRLHHGGAVPPRVRGLDAWAHCDIAGPAYLERAHHTNPKGGTGFGIATGVEFLRGLAGRG